jgi:hypothetical protein
MQREGAHEPEYNQFLINELLIDNCGTTDAVFATLLEGIICQDQLTSLTYINHNEIGPASVRALNQLFGLGTLRELNLTNIKIEQPQMSELLENLLPVESLVRLKLSAINLNNSSIISALLEVLQARSRLQYLCLSQCSI